jgi:hypothetical protein
MSARIGGYASIAYGDKLLQWIDTYAAREGTSRAVAVRAILLQFAVQYERVHTPGAVLPDAIRGWHVVAHHEGDIERRRETTRT